ncbi:MAG: D-alanine--D-alanine ligase [Nocardioidaceae bacterium]|nr:D-alanine--D-alanine ligase [Nocardioidaceae bacterium]
MNASAKPRVAVVFGGRSSEHAVSCSTAASVLSAIDKDRYDVVPVGISIDGKWVLDSGDADKLLLTASHVPVVDPNATAVVLSNDPSRREIVVAEPGQPPHALGAVDVVFPLLHGPWGEDGTIQGLFEMAGIRYVGSGVLASAVGMDKHYMKVVLAGAGVPVVPYVVIKPREWERDPSASREAVEALGYPVFVKPARGGSSLGITKVPDATGLDAAVEHARELDPKVLVETAAVDARELECGVLQRLDGGADASVVAEITDYGEHEFYDFEAKYLGEEGVTLEVPADLRDEVAEEVRRLAVVVFEALECEGLARVDFFCGEDGRLTVNEINTMPGFTPASMFPRMWAESGVDYPELVDRLLALAMQRSTGLR